MESLMRVDFGMTLRAEPVSTNTLAKASFAQLTEILNARLWYFPSSGSSSSQKPRLLHAVMLEIVLSN